MSTESLIKELALKHFDQVGLTQVRTKSSDALKQYAQWLAKGENGDMSYLSRHHPQKEDPQLLLKNAQSWISVSLDYDTQQPLSIEIADELIKNKQGWVARYARGEDYHQVIQSKLDELIKSLKVQFPEEEFLPCVDTKPVLERDVASRSGLGWVGKNTCLIDQERGSFFFIAEILTTLKLKSDQPVLDHCGTCTKCIDACPTGALVEPRHLDARKCISYWTIESKASAPKELADKFSYNFYGCDICQDVCPWNQKSRRKRELPQASTEGIVNLEALLQKDNNQIKSETSQSAMSRAKPEKLKENARIVLRNYELNKDIP